MRIINCRFDSLENMEKLLSKFGVEGNIEDIIEVNYDTKEIKRKKAKKTSKKGVDTSWRKHWIDMPEFNNEFAEEEYSKIKIVFDKEINYDEAKVFFEQNITDKTKSIWYPKLVQGKHRKFRVIGGRNPKYPIYVVSKGRYDFKGNTSNFLTKMCVKHFIVVEPQEYDLYVKNMQNEYCTVLKLDMSYKDNYDVFSDIGKDNSTGPGAARNFVWDDSIKRGYKWHWVLDDNIECFDRYWRGHKIYSHSPENFRCLEEFVDRYDNIAIAGLNYSKFCAGMSKPHAYSMNTRIYSFLLIRNDIPYRWRGRYNEDTDLSLRVLKDGWCTVQFNAYLAAKITTQKIKGGNTEEFYAKEGTLNKSKMLEDMHPDVAKVVWKFSRWHHEVDYSGFKQELKMKDEFKNLPKDTNEHGQIIVRIPEEWIATEKDCAKYILEHKDELERVDNTSIFL